MATYSLKLDNALKKYIDNLSAASRGQLRQLLQQTSSVDRFRLLMNVRGDKYRGNTGLHIAAISYDLETMKYMLEGFTVDQRYDVVKIQGGGLSALHYAASKGFPSIITYLLTDLSQQQKYNLLQLQNKDGNTPLHDAASQRKPETAQAILTSLSLPLLVHLLNVKNKRGQTVTDIISEAPKLLPGLISQGIVILHMLQLKYFFSRDTTQSVSVE